MTKIKLKKRTKKPTRLIAMVVQDAVPLMVVGQQLPLEGEPGCEAPSLEGGGFGGGEHPRKLVELKPLPGLGWETLKHLLPSSNSHQIY